MAEWQLDKGMLCAMNCIDSHVTLQYFVYDLLTLIMYNSHDYKNKEQ